MSTWKNKSKQFYNRKNVKDKKFNRSKSGNSNPEMKIKSSLFPTNERTKKYQNSYGDSHSRGGALNLGLQFYKGIKTNLINKQQNAGKISNSSDDFQRFKYVSNNKKQFTSQFNSIDFNNNRSHTSYSLNTNKNFVFQKKQYGRFDNEVSFKSQKFYNNYKSQYGSGKKMQDQQFKSSRSWDFNRGKRKEGISNSYFKKKFNLYGRGGTSVKKALWSREKQMNELRFQNSRRGFRFRNNKFRMLRKKFTGPYAKFLRKQAVANDATTTFNRKWYHCKKPYWRRKSFKFVKLFNLIYANTFKAYMLRRRKLLMVKKKNSKFNMFYRKKKYRGRRPWSEYFRRNKVKFWFRNKIALRLVWMNRYSCWTHKKTSKFVWQARRRTPTLLKFWRKYEFTLDRYIIWWQMLPSLTKNSLHFSRNLIKNGFVYVNFVPIVVPTYEVKLGDCIFLLKTRRRWKHHCSYMVTKLIGQYKSKFRRNYRLRLFRKYLEWYRFKPKFRTFISKYKRLKFLSHHAPNYFAYCYYFVEKSYKYKIFVNLYPLDWFTLAFSTIGKLYYIVNYYLANTFVNRRYG